MVRPVHGCALRQPAGHGHRWPDFQLRADPVLRAELDYCVPLGIPHSKFASWSDTDRGYALAWTRNKAETCNGCGTRPDQWDEDEHAFISDHWTCPGCQRIAEEQAQNLDKGADGNPVPGQHVYLTPREVYEAQQALKRSTPTDDDD